MPSIVLLIRSRLRIRPRSFSIRMPSKSSYWRLIFRRPASSFGRSSGLSSPPVSSTSKMLKAFADFAPPLVLSFLLFRARAIPRGDPSASTFGVAAVLVADPEEPAWTEPRELDDPALGAARRADSLPCRLAALLCGLRLLLCH